MGLKEQKKKELENELVQDVYVVMDGEEDEEHSAEKVQGVEANVEDKDSSEDNKEASPMRLEYDELVVFGIMMTPLSEQKDMEANDVNLMVNEELQCQRE